MNNTGPIWNFPQNTAQNTGGFSQNTYTQPNPYQPVWNRPTTPVLPGKIISSMQDIRPNEIPTDGSPSIFPANDFSCIFIKAWDQDGNIRTVKYVPENQTQQASNEFGLIMEKLNKLEVSLQQSIASIQPNQQQNRRPKEGGNSQ